MHFVNAKSILSSKNGMNLYRGCSHGCIYCDSRSKCYHMEYDFEDIEIKANAIELLENTLKRKRAKCMLATKVFEYLCSFEEKNSPIQLNPYVQRCNGNGSGLYCYNCPQTTSQIF